MEARFPRVLILTLLSATAAIGAIAAVYGGFKHFYFQGPFLDAISYSSDETRMNAIVAGWTGSDPSQTLVGIHVFGDFLLPSYWSGLANPWLEGANYPPLALALFDGLAALPYHAGLTLFLVVCAVAMLLPMVWASRGWDLPTRMLLVVILVVLSGPFLATLDRGNIQGLMPPLLFGFAVCAMRGRWITAGVLVGAMGAIKLYPLVLLLLLLGERRWKAIGVSVLTFAVLTGMSLILVSDNVWPSALNIVVNNFGFGGEGYRAFMSFNTSLAGGIAHWAALFGLSDVSAWIAGNPWVIVAVYVLAVAALMFQQKVPLLWRILLVLTLITASTPIAYPYAANWVLTATAVVVLCSNPRSPSESIRLPVMMMVLALALALVTAPYPFYIPGSSEAGIPAGMLTLLIPVTSIALLGLAFLAWRRSRAVPLVTMA